MEITNTMRLLTNLSHPNNSETIYMEEFEQITQRNFRFSIRQHPQKQIEVMQLLSEVMQSYRLNAYESRIVANWFHETYKDAFTALDALTHENKP